MDVVELEDLAAVGRPGRRALGDSLGHCCHRRGAEIGLDHLRVLLHLCRRSLGDLLAVVEHRHAVGDPHHDFHVVLDEQDGQVFFLPKARDERREVGRLLRVHPRGRLVEEDELRLGRERTGHLEPSLVAVGEVPRPRFPLVSLEAAEREQLAGAFCGFALFPLDTGRPQNALDNPALESGMHPDHHVLPRSHLLEQTDVLEGPSDPPLGDRMRRLAGHVVTCEHDLPAGRLVDAREAVEERGLAGAVRADQADDRPLGDVEIDVVDGDQAPELLPHLGRDEEVAHSGPPLTS